MGNVKNSSKKHTSQPSTKPRTDDVCPLVPPFKYGPLAWLGSAAATRAWSMNVCFHEEEFAGLEAHKSLLSGDEFQTWAKDERAAWERVYKSLKPLYGKPLTQKMVFNLIAPAIAACAIAGVEDMGQHIYGGGEQKRDEESRATEKERAAEWDAAKKKVENQKKAS